MGQIDIDSVQQYYQRCHTPTLRCDGRLRVIWSNEAAAKLFDLAGEPPLTSLFPQIDHDFILEHLTDEGNFEVEISDANLTTQLDFHPVVQEGEENSCFVLLLSSPIQQKPRRTKMDSQSAFDQFTHQNRYSIARIFNTLPILKYNLERYELYDEILYLNQISGNCYSILKSILICGEYNRLLCDKHYLKLVKADLRIPLEHLLSGVRLLLLHTDLNFSYELPSEPLLTEADTEKLNLALLQLIANACQYTSPGNRVVVTVGRQKQTITIRVSDKGVGIPPENLQKIFTPFFSFNPNTNTYAGMGLGLPFARQVVRLHGGECIVSSSLNHGTTVSMSFPIRDTPDAPTLESDSFEYALGRFSPISVYLSDVCPIPID